MECHPLDGMAFGVVGATTPLVDVGLDEGRLPAHMRAVPRRAAPCHVGREQGEGA